MSQLLQTPEAGDATATLYDRHHSRIRGYCLGQLRDREEADDAVQSTFLYAFAMLQRGVTPRDELPWLFTIAHNVCRTRRRSLRRRSRLEAAIDLDTLRDTVGRNDSPPEELDGLGSSLAALPETQRRALLLREWRGLSYAEVAARMDLTESAVEAVLFRARRSLAQRLRAADRVASLASGAFLLRSLRRLGSLSGTGKAAVAAVAVSLAAGTAIPPLVHLMRHTPSTPRHAAPAQGVMAQAAPHPAAAKPPVRQSSPASALLAAPDHIGGPNAATRTVAPDRPPEAPAPQTRAATAEPSDVPTETPLWAPMTEQPPRAATAPLVPTVPATLDAPKEMVPNLQSALPQLADPASVPPPPVQAVAPNVPPPNPPVPDLSPKGTPLQVGP